MMLWLDPKTQMNKDAGTILHEKLRRFLYFIILRNLYRFSSNLATQQIIEDYEFVLAKFC